MACGLVLLERIEGSGSTGKASKFNAFRLGCAAAL